MLFIHIIKSLETLAQTLNKSLAPLRPGSSLCAIVFSYILILQEKYLNLSIYLFVYLEARSYRYWMVDTSTRMKVRIVTSILQWRCKLTISLKTNKKICLVLQFILAIHRNAQCTLSKWIKIYLVLNPNSIAFL